MRHRETDFTVRSGCLDGVPDQVTQNLGEVSLRKPDLGEIGRDLRGKTQPVLPQQACHDLRDIPKERFEVDGTGFRRMGPVQVVRYTDAVADPLALPITP